MTRKLMVLGLAAVLVVAVAIPVVAQDRVVTPKLQKISKRALKSSQAALRKARAANRQARAARALAADAASAAAAARAQAAGAGSAAGEAKAIAEQARSAQGATRIQRASAPGGEATSSSAFVALAGGPRVTVDVPASGLIEVWAQATIDGEGAVSLFEGETPVPGQAELCSPTEGEGILFAVSGTAGEPIAVSTPAAGTIGICGTLGAPGPVLFEVSPGTHTYELRYASCGCEDPAEAVTFSDRRLYVAPRP